MSDDSGLDIAVVGMAGRFPGAADVDEFWRAVLRGEPTVSRFAPDELSAAGVPAEEHGHPDYVPVFGDLADADRFDAGLFGYTPRDARLIDPQQRVFLECAWAALESAGHLTDVEEQFVGIYAATAMSTYLLKNLSNAGPSVGSDYEIALANEKDAIATRTAYHLGLRGPAVAVQTACSSSLVAVHLAGQALLAGECDTALAGAAHVRLPIGAGYRYETGGIMARDGVCRPFDAAATGTVGGSGVAVVVLRRLADAVADGDTIHAVIKGSAVNNDGWTKVGYTAPSVVGQVDVIRTAHQAAEVTPETVGYIETHGTGTALGDQVEFAALREVFGQAGRCALGSVKAVTGHLDVAAGVTGLIKACLAVRHGVVPPSPYFTAPHPDLPMAGDPFFVNAEQAPWPVAAAPRRAGVSSFGIGGTNAHVVVEQAPVVAAAEHRPGEHVLVLSARTGQALARARERLRDHLVADGPALADVAYTLRRTRRRFDHRLAVVARDRAEAARALADESTVDMAVGEVTDGSVAFLLPGQGAQHAGMGEELYRTEPVFREQVDACADMLTPHLGLDLRAVLYRDSDDDLLRQTRITQPALFTVEYALARLWAHRGIRPAALVGHSIGEYVAACLAGVFSLPDALAIVAARGELMQSTQPGAMLSVSLPHEELAARLPRGVELAAVNAPRLCAVAGPRDAIAAVASELRGNGIACRELRTSHAFHSASMEPITAAFADHVARFDLRAPTIPLLSNVTGDWVSEQDVRDPKYWARQLREPVRFDDCARRLLAGHLALLEVGPGATLTTLVRQHPGADARSTASLPGPKDRQTDRVAMAAALGRLWLAGVDVDWDRAAPSEGCRRVPLPTYPFQRERHWVEPGGTTEPAPAAEEPSRPALSVLETIRQIWVELLGIPDVGPDQDFFALGGHSLLGTKVVARIRETLHVDLSGGALFETPTINGLVATVERLRAEQAESDRMAELLAEIRSMSPTQVRAQLADNHGEDQS
jgi:phthiocerol/phenolphthiocerol synthesis type-I polyketide synthase E